MLRATTSLLLILMLCCLKNFAQQQPDTIIVYDVDTQLTDTILPIAFSPTVVADGTTCFVGSMGNPTPLSLTPPTTNLYSGATFSKPARAAGFFNLTSYPVRTAVSLQTYLNGTFTKACSGMIVAPNFVLSSAACVYNFLTKTFSYFDSLQVVPAYNNGLAQPGIPKAWVKKVYIFKTFHDQTNWDDIALLELKDPIGYQTGWTAIGFDNTPNAIANRVFHKFSYPSAPQPSNPSLVYNGDTLYYNYGLIGESSTWLLVNSAEAVPGQGGSTLMYTPDNIQYYSFGISSFSNDYLHYKITSAAFYQLQSVMESNAIPLGIRDNKPEINLRLYPNPFSQQTILEFDHKAGEDYTLMITNSLGQPVREPVPVSSGRSIIYRNGLAAGLYVLQLKNNKEIVYSSKLVIE